MSVGRALWRHASPRLRVLAVSVLVGAGVSLSTAVARARLGRRGGRLRHAPPPRRPEPVAPRPAAPGLEAATPTPEPADPAARAFELDPAEPIRAELRRVARGRLDDPREGLDGASPRCLGKAVHEARKDLKRLRALLRLAREGLDETEYRRETQALRDGARRLAGARDAKVLVEALDSLCELCPDDLDRDGLAPLRDGLTADQAAQERALRENRAAVGPALDELAAARARVEAWQLDRCGVGAVAGGLRRTYRRGRREWRQARDEPSVENLHEWRKRVKYLWHCAELLRAAAPERMEPLAARLHTLSDRLGDDHDLALLRQQALGPHGSAVGDPVPLALLLVAIDRRRAELQAQALELGAELYRRKPRRFAGRIEREWRARMPAGAD